MRLYPYFKRVEVNFVPLLPVKSVVDKILSAEESPERFAYTYLTDRAVLLYQARYKYVLPKYIVASDFSADNTTNNFAGIYADLNVEVLK